MKVLAIGAHPDDVEIGCAGFLVMGGVSAYILHLSNGETSKYADGETRKNEAEAAARILNAQVYFFDIPGRRIAADEETRLRLIGLIRKTRPDFLISHWDGDGHPDHRTTHKLVREAFHLSGARADLEDPPWKCLNLFYFHPFSSHYSFNPGFVLDISSVYPKKIESLRCHHSQVSFILQQVEAVSAYFGCMSGVERGEPFRAEMPLVITPHFGLVRKETPPG